VRGDPTPAERKAAFDAFGFTDDPAEHARVRTWRDAAVADGWTAEQTYQHEPIESHATLSRDSWRAHCMAREKSGGRYRFEAQISVWGPDGLAVEPGQTYSFEKMTAGLRTCGVCGAKDVPTIRYSFAGRCCEACRPEMKRQHERPGWNR
jgi:hypothetical protein